MEAQNKAIAQMTTGERVKAIFASSSGNLVEWFDFYAYSFSAIYFAQAFFPKGDQTTQLLQTQLHRIQWQGSLYYLIRG